MSDDMNGLTRRAMLRGVAVAGAASLVRPAAGIGLAGKAAPGVFSRSVGSLAGESGAIAAPQAFALVGVEWRAPQHATLELRTRRRAAGPGAGGRRPRFSATAPTGPAPKPARRSSGRRSGPVRPTTSSSAARVRVQGVRLHFVAALRGAARARRDGPRRAGAAARPAGARRRPGTAADHRARGLGAGTRAPQPRPAVRDGQARVRPSQRDAQRLQRRRRPVDPAVDLRLSPLRPRLLRHRLQLRDRRVRPDLGGAGRWRRSAGDRRARRWLQPGVDRDGRARLVHGHRALARPQSQRSSSCSRGSSSLHGAPALGRVTVEVAPDAAFYTPFRPGAHVSLPRVAGHRDGDETSCPGNAFYARLPSIRRALRL